VPDRKVASLVCALQIAVVLRCAPLMITATHVIPVKAGVHWHEGPTMDPRLRGGDDDGSGFLRVKSRGRIATHDQARATGSKPQVKCQA